MIRRAKALLHRCGVTITGTLNRCGAAIVATVTFIGGFSAVVAIVFGIAFGLLVVFLDYKIAERRRRRERKS